MKKEKTISERLEDVDFPLLVLAAESEDEYIQRSLQCSRLLLTVLSVSAQCKLQMSQELLDDFLEVYGF